MNDELNEYLYHYTSLDKGLSEILGSGYFKLNSLQDMNDPMDSDPRYFQINFENKPDDDVVAEGYRLRRELDQYIRGQCQIGCFTLDTTDARDNGVGDGAKHGRMWAQYAAQNRGLCLVFRKTELDNAFEKEAKKQGLKPIYKEVEYDDGGYDTAMYEVKLEELRKKNGVKKVAQRNLLNEHIVHEFFFKKTLDWENEAEYRFVCHGKNVNRELCIPIKDSLAFVVLGTKVSNSYVPSLLEVSKEYNGVKLRRADFTSNGFEFRLSAAKYDVPIDLSPADKAARKSEHRKAVEERETMNPLRTQN